MGIFGTFGIGRSAGGTQQYYCCGTRTSEEFIVVLQFREPGVCPIFCPFTSALVV
jgi:hypothetical protein